MTSTLPSAPVVGAAPGRATPVAPARRLRRRRALAGMLYATPTAVFVGGDAIGIGATSAKAAQAWDFLSWTMSDEAQVEVVAKSKGVPTRTDLASNKYSQSDERVVLINSLMAKGRTPYAKNFNASFNDPQSPWLQTVRGALFGDAGTALSGGNAAITKSLQQS